MIYVDTIMHCTANAQERQRIGSTLFCHMWADIGGTGDLHAMAKRLGVPDESFVSRRGYGHYTITPDQRKLAVAYGVKEVDMAEWVRTHKPPPRSNHSGGEPKY